MNRGNIFSVKSLKLWCWFVHFLATTFLFWTKYDSIGLVTYSDLGYKQSNEIYLVFISLALLLLCWKALVFNYSTNLTFLFVFDLFLDALGSFLVLWISIDGLDWRTYIIVFLVCMCVKCINVS